MRAGVGVVGHTSGGAHEGIRAPAVGGRAPAFGVSSCLDMDGAAPSCALLARGYSY